IFLYITIFQMVPLFKHYRTFMWLDLYPVSNKEKKHAFMTLSIRLSVIQFCLFTLVFFFTVKLEMVALWIILASLFIFLFHRLYLQQKLFHHSYGQGVSVALPVLFRPRYLGKYLCSDRPCFFIEIKFWVMMWICFL